MSKFVANYLVEDVLRLAPDASSAKSGKELANPGKWQNLGTDLAYIWGYCQGSGAKPYETQVDLTAPAFKCSCPSRKFPCKHGLALLLLAMTKTELFVESASAPDWVAQWIESRQEKSAKKKEKEEKPRTEEELAQLKEAKEKRKNDRFAKVEAGIETLELFLEDCLRQGTSTLQNKPFAYWQERAARLVDAQAPGLAKRVLNLSNIKNQDYHSQFLSRAASIFMLTRAFKNYTKLPPTMQEDILSAIGFTASQEELLKEDGVKDDWLVLGQYVTVEERLRVQKTYLRGQNCGKIALLLSFAHGTAPFDILMVPGKTYPAELVYFSSRAPLRVLKKESGAASDNYIKPVIECSLSQAVEEFRAALAKNPFVEYQPIFLGPVSIVRQSNNWYTVDQDHNMAPLTMPELPGWQLYSCAAGQPVHLFGEWDGETITPLSIFTERSYHRIAVKSEVTAP